MALMGSTAGFGASDLNSDDSEYDAAVKSGDIRNVMAVLEKEYRLPAGYLAKTAQVESRMNPSAQNPNSSAGGLFQFINSTAKRYGLADKMDPVQSTLAAAQLAGDNADYLSGRLGREPTTPELYAAHQQGAAGAAKILAQPNAMMTDLVGGRAASLNGAGNLTGGQFIDRFARKLGMNSPSTTVSTAPTPSFSEDDPTTTGSIGLMNKPPAPKENEYPLLNGNMRDIIMAMGMSMMGGKKGDYFGRVPESYQALQAMSAKAADRKYDMYKDSRDFGFRQGESERAQANTDRTFGLQEKQFGLSQQNTDADNRRADEQLKLQRDNANRPDRVTTPDGGIVELPKDGSAPRVVIPGQRPVTESSKVAERERIADAYELPKGSPERAQYLLNGKLPEGAQAPTTRNIKQADGSEVAVQWDSTNSKWVPLTAPEGGNPVRPGGAKLTEGQSKDLAYFDRASKAQEILDKHGDALQSGVQQGLSKIPGAGNYVTSEEFKLGNQAGKSFLTAILRKESGAVIGPQEEKNYGSIFLPQPGDPASVVAQKREARQIALDSIKKGLGPGQALARATPSGMEPKPTTEAEYAAIPVDAPYIAPNGQRYIKKAQ